MIDAVQDKAGVLGMRDPSEMVGEVLEDRFRVIRYVGVQPHGLAYEAEDLEATKLPRPCSLTLLRAQVGAREIRALEEMQALASLSGNHPGLLAYRGVGRLEQGGGQASLYVVTEVADLTLEDRLRRTPGMTRDEVKTLALQAAETLSYLHERGAVHGEVRPGTLVRVGGRWKLGALGLIWLLESLNGPSAEARSGIYSAPEIVEGRIETPADVFALGMILHHALDHQAALKALGEASGTLARAYLLRSVASLPPPLDSVVLGCTLRDVARRWTASQLEGVLSGRIPLPSSVSLPPSVGPRSLSRDPSSAPSGGQGEPSTPPVGGLAGLRAVLASEGVGGVEISAGPAPLFSQVEVDEGPAGTPVPGSPGMFDLGRNAAGFKEYRNQRDGSVLILIPPGPFRMGSDDGEGLEDESPAHVLTLPAYAIGKTPVTNLQFDRFVRDTGHDPGPDWLEIARLWGAFAPVVCVSWHDAQAYCRWAGLRLPTEAEWEKAARGNDSRRYPWGNAWQTDFSWFRENSEGRARDVGTRKAGASRYGCLDMAGNVWEWCSSLYRPYPYRQHDGREALSSRESRVVRGGSWGSVSRVLRAPYRAHSAPEGRSDGYGFRVVHSFAGRPAPGP